MNRTETRNLRKDHMVKIGLNPDHISDWRKKWKGLKQTSVTRGSEFKLSFEEYVTIAVESGLTHYSQIGRRFGEHGMARYGDEGAYEYGNCRFITTTDNIAERSVNGGTQRQVEKMSQRFRAVSPTGEVYVGDNLTKFTREMGLSSDYLGKIARRVHVSRAGWKCDYLDKDEK